MTEREGGVENAGWTVEWIVVDRVIREGLVDEPWLRETLAGLGGEGWLDDVVEALLDPRSRRRMTEQVMLRQQVGKAAVGLAVAALDPRAAVDMLVELVVDGRVPVGGSLVLVSQMDRQRQGNGSELLEVFLTTLAEHGIRTLGEDLSSEERAALEEELIDDLERSLSAEADGGDGDDDDGGGAMVS